jgi:hypothetical protein
MNFACDLHIRFDDWTGKFDEWIENLKCLLNE